MTHPATEDRRHRRSQDPLVALHYQLAHARREGRHDALVLADDAGLVLAGAGSWAVCEELAAYAPLLADGVWTEPGMARGSRVGQLSAEVDVQPVDVGGGQTVLLCSRGGARGSAAMNRAARGVARILATAA